MSGNGLVITTETGRHTAGSNGVEGTVGREPVHQVLVLIDCMHTHKIFWLLHTEKKQAWTNDQGSYGHQSPGKVISFPDLELI